MFEVSFVTLVLNANQFWTLHTKTDGVIVLTHPLVVGCSKEHKPSLQQVRLRPN